MVIGYGLILALLVIGSHALEHEVKQEELTYVGGSIDGKLYYTIPNQVFTWQEAKDICERNNLTMGTIRSAAQTNLLTKAAWFGDLDSVWTSARVYYESVKSLKWDNTVDSQPDEKLFVRFLGLSSMELCGWYESLNNMFYTNRCSSRYHVLCQNHERP